MNEEKTPPWKSFVYALAGALAIYCSIYLGDVLHEEPVGAVMMGIWGATFWVGGIGNLFVDRRHEKARKESIQ